MHLAWPLTCTLLLAAQNSLPPLEDGKIPQTVKQLWAGYDSTKEPLEVRIIREFFKDETEPSLFDTARAEIEWRHEVLQRALKDLLPERDRIRYFELTKQAEAAVTNWQRKKLVRRSHLRTIVLAWLITVPATAAIAGVLYHAMALVI